MLQLVNKEVYQTKLLEDIEYFVNTQGITNILPLNSITINQNDKSIWGNGMGEYGFCKCKTKNCNNCDTWKTKEVSLIDINNSIKTGTTGFIIKTGICNNIFVIDWDTGKGETPESIAIKEACLKSKTLTIKTPAGGYHFYYKFDNQISRGILGMYGNIDIRTTDNCCFFGIRADGEYSIVDNKSIIKNCPQIVLDQIVNKIEDKRKKFISDSLEADKTNRYEVSVEQVESYYITDDNLKSLLAYLSELDTNFVNDYNKWLAVTIICKKINLPDRYVKNDYTKPLNAKKIWDDWSKTSKKYNFKNNQNIWKSINLNKRDENDKLVYTYQLNYIVKCINTILLKNYNANKREYLSKKAKGIITPKPINFTLPRYERIFIPYDKVNNLKRPKVINQRYLDDSAIANENITIIESGLGTGKTRVTNDHITNNNKKVLSLVHLISLCENQISNFNKLISEKNIDKSREMKSYKDNDIKETNSLNTTIHSLIGISNKINSIAKNPTTISEHFDTIFIDEAHRIIHTLFSNPCINSKRKELIELIISIVRNAKQVILTDGDFDLLTSDFIKLIGRKYKYTKNAYKSFNNIPVKFVDDIRLVYLSMYNNVKEGKYFTCCCNTKKETDNIHTLLLSWGVPEKDIVIYTSTNKEPLNDATTDWNNKYVLYSPTIVEGVDRVSIEAEIVYQLIISETTINIIQLKQQICRNRNIKHVIICFQNMTNECNFRNQDDFSEAIKMRKRLYNDSKFNTDIDNYDKLSDMKFDNIKGIFTNTDNIISNLYITSRWIDYGLRVNMKSSLASVLTGLGFEIEYDPILNLKECLEKHLKIINMERKEYVFGTTRYITDTDDNGIVEEKKLVNVNTTNFHSWLNRDCSIIYDIDTDNKLKDAINLIAQDNIEGDFTYKVKSKINMIDIKPIIKTLYDKFICWRNGGIISDKNITTDYSKSPYMYNKFDIIADKSEANIINITDRYYTRLGFERLMVNMGDNKYAIYNRIFKGFNELYDKRNVSTYNSKMDLINPITQYTKIDRKLSTDIISYKYDTIDKIIKTNRIKLLEDENNTDIETLRSCYYKRYSENITRLYSNKLYYDWYVSMRLYILDNETLLSINKKNDSTDSRIINTETKAFQIYKFKTLFKKYFPEINLFNLEHADKGKYFKEKTELVDNDLSNEFIPLIKQTGTKSKLKYETKDDLLKVFRVLLSNIFSVYFISSQQKSVKVDNKPVKQNIYSIKNNVEDLTRLILLTNDIKNIDSDLKELYNLEDYKTINFGFIDDDYED